MVSVVFLLMMCVQHLPSVDHHRGEGYLTQHMAFLSLEAWVVYPGFLLS